VDWSLKEKGGMGSDKTEEQKFGSAVMKVGGYDNNLLFFKF
jgi:hypothetical protein